MKERYSYIERTAYLHLWKSIQLHKYERLIYICESPMQMNGKHSFSLTVKVDRAAWKRLIFISVTVYPCTGKEKYIYTCERSHTYVESKEGKIKTVIYYQMSMLRPGKEFICYLWKINTASMMGQDSMQSLEKTKH